MGHSSGFDYAETRGNLISKLTIICKEIRHQYHTLQRDEHTMILNILTESNDQLEVLYKIHQKRMGFLALIRNNKTVHLHPLMSRWDVLE